MYELFEYQKQMWERARRWVKDGARRVLNQLPTGGGKTVLFAAQIQKAVELNEHVLFVVHRRELVRQASRTLSRMGVHHGILMPGYASDESAPVQVATIQTYMRRMDWMRWFRPRLAVIDEAHYGLEGQLKLQEFLDFLRQDVVYLGYTATPATPNAKGLGAAWDVLNQGPTISQLTLMGRLVPGLYYQVRVLEAERIRTRGGDYDQGEVEKLANTREMNGDIVEFYLDKCQGRPTVVFAATIGHSLGIVNEFARAGIKAAHIDWSTPDDARQRYFEMLSRGELVISNVDVMSEGVDIPPISAIILAGLTKVPTRYIQRVGRGFRAHPGKQDCLVIDMAGNIRQLGLVSDYEDWDLQTGQARPSEATQKLRGQQKDVVCKSCGHVFRGTRICPQCGHDHIKVTEPEYIKVLGGVLEAVQSKRPKKYLEELPPERWFAQLLDYGIQRHYKNPSYWAYKKVEERFGAVRFNARFIQPEPCSKQVERWVKHTHIRWWRAREKVLTHQANLRDKIRASGG